MTLPIAFVLLLCVVVLLLLAWEILPPDVVAMSTLVVVALTGLITPKEAFASFSNEAPLTVAAMFVISAAITKAGLISDMARFLGRMPKVGETKLLLAMIPLVAIASAFMNNTPVVVALMPVVLSLARQQEIAASKLLIPLSYAAILGGTCTLIGTSTNLVVSSIAHQKYGIEFSLFQITGLGLIVLVGGGLFLAFVGRHLLPTRETLATLVQETGAREYVTELVVESGSSMIGKSAGETPLARLNKARLQSVIRDGLPIGIPARKVVLQANDVVQFAAQASDVVDLHDFSGMATGAAGDAGLTVTKTEEAIVLEVVVTNNSRLAGRTVEDLRFFERYRAMVLAVHRRGSNLMENLNRIELRFGDTLLLKMPKERLSDFRESRDLLPLTDSVITPPRRDKRVLVMATLVVLIGLATFNIYPISLLALTAVVFLTLTRCVRVSEIYESIDWRIVSMIIGMLALGTAMERTGAAQWMAGGVVDVVRGQHPVLLIAGFYLLTSVLTEIISNNAVAVIFTPIAVQTAIGLGIDPMPLLVAVMFGASASFATPIGYQTNTFVYSAGGYRFSDFLKVGVPMNCLTLIIASIFIPIFFPLYPEKAKSLQPAAVAIVNHSSDE